MKSIERFRCLFNKLMKVLFGKFDYVVQNSIEFCLNLRINVELLYSFCNIVDVFCW